MAAQSTFAQTLRISGEVPREFVAGESGAVHLYFLLNDPESLVEQGVLYLNVVVNSKERGYPQAAHRVFAGASEEPAIFRRVLTGQQLREGVETTVRFDMRSRAPLEEYFLVFQLFHEDQTSPHRVRIENKLAHINFPFRIVAAPSAQAE